jgi:hypothetical protein
MRFPDTPTTCEVEVDVVDGGDDPLPPLELVPELPSPPSPPHPCRISVDTRAVIDDIKMPKRF